MLGRVSGAEDGGHRWAAVSVGDRVVLRYRLPPGSSHPMTDVLGELAGMNPVVVRTAQGRMVTVDTADVVALKSIPPPPVTSRTTRSR